MSNDESIAVNVRIPVSLKEGIEEQAQEQHRSFSGQVRYILEAAVTPPKRPRPALARNDMGGLCVAPDPSEPVDRELKA